MSDASGTGFFDTKNRKWSDELIARCGLDKAIFPDCLESVDLAGTVTKEAAEETGLEEGANVYAGGVPSQDRDRSFQIPAPTPAASTAP